MLTLTHHQIFHDPAYPSSVALTEIQKKLIDETNRRIDGGDLVYEDIPCLCGSENFDLVSTYDRYRVKQPVVLCRDCGLLQCRPRMAAATLDWFYKSDFYRQLSGKLLPHTHDLFARMVAGGLTERHRFIKDHIEMEVETLLRSLHLSVND